MTRSGLYSDGARRFFAYWDGLPKDGLLPDLSSVDPDDIVALMPTVTILEYVSPERIDMRLVGPVVREVLGFDPTGQNYLELQAAEAKALYLRLVDVQLSLPCGRRNILKMRHADGVITRVEAVTLPMRYKLFNRSVILSYFGTLDIIGFGDGGYQVLDFEDTEWIDIGAGIPDWG